MTDPRMTPTNDAPVTVEQCVMVCPQCEGEGGYADGIDDAACHTACTRCGSNGWIVDLAALASAPAGDGPARIDHGASEALGEMVWTTAPAGDGVEEAAKPWADFHGPLPDFDHPLRAVFESGVQYAVELLAKTLGVEEYTPCDGTEEYDGDLGGTMMNIVLEAMPKDDDGDPILPRDLAAALARPRAAVGEREA